MRILVTGASGFVGSHVCDYLKKQKIPFVGCGRKNIVRDKDEYIICDLTKEVPKLDVDIIIHTAALGPTANASFYDYFNNNVVATLNVLEYAKRHSVKRLIYMGAVASYGTYNGVLQECSPHNNPDFYGLTKYIAEELVKDSSIPYYILVLPGVFGAGYGNIWITRVAEALYNNRNVEYYNERGLFNNILDVEDLCDFIGKLLFQGDTKSETYLLGSVEKIKVGELITYLKTQLLSASEIYAIEDEKNAFYLDISKAIAAGFESKPIQEILSHVCKEVTIREENRRNSVIKL